MASVPNTMKKIRSACRIAVSSGKGQRRWYEKTRSVHNALKPHPPNFPTSRNSTSHIQRDYTMTLYKVKDEMQDLASKIIRSRVKQRPASLLKTPFRRKSTIISKPVITPELNVIKKSETARWVLRRNAPQQLGRVNELKRLVNAELAKQLFDLWDGNKVGKVTVGNVSAGLSLLGLAENSSFTQSVIAKAFGITRLKAYITFEDFQKTLSAESMRTKVIKELDRHIGNYFQLFKKVQCASELPRSKSVSRVLLGAPAETHGSGVGESGASYTSYMLARKNAQMYNKQAILREVQSKCSLTRR